MQLILKARHRHAQTLREWALARMGAALRRIASKILRATVQLSDIDGRRHGIDKRCQIEILPSQGDPVVVTALARDWKVALKLALDKAVQTSHRLLDRAECARRGRGIFARRRERVERA